MNVLVAIPARYGSTRFPGKPLAPLLGEAMVARVARRAGEALRGLAALGIRGRVCVAADDERVMRFAREHAIPCVMTPLSCPTGTDRAFAAAIAPGDADASERPDVVVNWQGDNPFAPARFVTALLAELARDPRVPVATPCVRLRWADLDRLRDEKKTTPFGGTFAVLRDVQPLRADDDDASTTQAEAGTVARGDALYFSKREIPAVRDEAARRAAAPDANVWSPFYRHVGLYAVRFDALTDYATRWTRGPLEIAEGLEQLRFLENGAPIRTLIMDDGGRALPSGVDSPEDVTRAETWLREGGDD